MFCSRRENEHDQIVRSIYEDMETQLREERDKSSTQVQMRVGFAKSDRLYSSRTFYCEIKESMRQKQRVQLEEVLKTREQDLENTVSRQREVGVQRPPRRLEA